MLRVGMTNPPFILDHLDAIAEVSALDDIAIITIIIIITIVNLAKHFSNKC